MVPVGSNNILVEMYRVVPGARGNIGPGEVQVCDALGDAVVVTNVLPATGGRDAETIEEITRRAPSLLTSRDRAVTRVDFETIAKQASGEVARAACPGDMGEDGTVEVVVLPHRRSGEDIPDPFLSAGLRDHVSSYLRKRCLININPKVRLAEFKPIDISLTLRLRPNANVIHVREQAEAWARAFLDPYEGGIEREGWSFGGTLYAQDFARMVSDIREVRHVSEVRLYGDLEEGDRPLLGWETGEGMEVLQLTQRDLFQVMRIRVQIEDELW
jgi:predicted phage baseplate assembly protein